MIRRNPLATVLVVLLALALLDGLLLLSGYRILVGEEARTETYSEGFPQAGIPAVTSEYRDCSYFTGRSVQVTSVPAERLDECPALFKPYPASGF